MSVRGQHFNYRPIHKGNTLTRSCWWKAGAGRHPVTNRRCIGLFNILLPVTGTKQSNVVRQSSCNKWNRPWMLSFEPPRVCPCDPRQCSFIPMTKRTSSSIRACFGCMFTSKWGCKGMRFPSIIIILIMQDTHYYYTSNTKSMYIKKLQDAFTNTYSL